MTNKTIQEKIEEFKKDFGNPCAHGTSNRLDFKEYANFTMVENWLTKALEQVEKEGYNKALDRVDRMLKTEVYEVKLEDLTKEQREQHTDEIMAFRRQTEAKLNSLRQK